MFDKSQLKKWNNLNNQIHAKKMDYVLQMIVSQFDGYRATYGMYNTVYCALDGDIDIFMFLPDIDNANALFRKEHNKDIKYMLEIKRTGMTMKATHYLIVDHKSKEQIGQMEVKNAVLGLKL